MRINEIQVTIQLQQDPGFPGRATIKYEEMEIHGFTIRSSKPGIGKYNYFVSPPSIKVGNGFKKIFFVNNSEEWKQIEEKILREFDKCQTDYPVTGLDTEEYDIKIEDIPFN